VPAQFSNDSDFQKLVFSTWVNRYQVENSEVHIMDLAQE
jgi:hypothetical protein